MPRQETHEEYVDRHPQYRTEDGSVQSCRAGRDGECTWDKCPQSKDDEPSSTGRDCPLPHWTEDPQW